ncbi:hypothetical protein FRC08_009776 [Ceratobasidium sp. 394]|nr:hypothetical protein FRC08_009776 [Ceratobasidium sp. 394]KAG9095891.1 hypothetical protein FS749_009528 [Ceratobasidium sp. UAMH 11750]
MYATTGEKNRVWTARDERELKAEHKRLTRATAKHLGKLPIEQDRNTLLDKLLRRHAADSVDHLPPHKRPLPPKTPTDHHWWSRKSSSSPRTPGRHEQPQEYGAMAAVAGPSRAPPPIPPRYDLMPQAPVLAPAPPARPRRQSEKASAARQRARETALRHLEVDRGFRRYVRDNKNYVPPPLAPGTWIPGQLNPVPFDDPQPGHDGYQDDYDYNLVNDYGALPTPELYKHFPLPPTQPLNIVPRPRNQETRHIPVPPIPPMPGKSNRESFLELRKKRSYRV